MPGAINYLPNRSSVILYLPGVEGALDYRVFAVEDGVEVELVDDGREHVDGATLHCAGLRQRNQCDEGAKFPIEYNTEELDLPDCELPGIDRRPHVPATVMQTLEVNGIHRETTLVVEAIDRQCPFPGLWGTYHIDYKIVSSDIGGPTVEATVDGRPYTLKRWQDTFPMRTEDEIRADYGSMIINGQGWNKPTFDPDSPDYPESPYIRLAQPAPPDDPVVLGRAVIKVAPLPSDELPEGFDEDDYFDDFDDDSDQPKLLRDTDYTGEFAGLPIKVYTTDKWVLYDNANGFSDFFVDRGQLHMVHADTAQGTMTSQAMYPKRPVQLPTEEDRYLHVTYEAQRLETARRYENLALCGADTPGETYDGETPKAAPLPRPNFMNEDDTARTNVLGWNCLYLVARGPGYGVLPGGDVRSHTDTSLKITVIRSHPAPRDIEEYDHEDIGEFATGFGPTQEPAFPQHWLRQVDSRGNISGVWLDDQLHAWQRARFDVFIRRDRVIIYVNGEQRICQGLDASPLTMAEGALGFWHVLYHSSAEFLEIRAYGGAGDNPRTGLRHILHNTPFADHRSFDNVGFREDVPLPDGFDESRCLSESSDD